MALNLLGRRVAGPTLVAGLIGFLGLVTASPLASVGGPVGGLLWWHWDGLRGRRRAEVAARAEVIDVVDGLTQHLRGGGSLRSGLGPTDPVAALAPTAADEARLLGSTIEVLVTRGGPALRSLEGLSDVLRSNQALRAELDLQAGQATASAMVLAVLPVGFVAALALADTRLRHFYLFEVGGAACLLLAVVLSYGGWWTMQHLVEARR